MLLFRTLGQGFAMLPHDATGGDSPGYPCRHLLWANEGYFLCDLARGRFRVRSGETALLASVSLQLLLLGFGRHTDKTQ